MYGQPLDGEQTEHKGQSVKSFWRKVDEIFIMLHGQKPIFARYCPQLVVLHKTGHLAQRVVPTKVLEIDKARRSFAPE